MVHRMVMGLLLLLAGTSALSAKSNGQAAVSEEVLAVQNTWFTATATCNLPEIERVLSKDMIFIHHSGRVQLHEEVMAPYRTCSPRTGTPLQSNATKVRVMGDTAIISGDLQWGEGVGGPRGKGSFLSPTGSEAFGHFLYSQVYARLNGSWMLVQHQSTAVPASDFPLP